MTGGTLIPVDFHGDRLEATQDETGRVWVVVKRVCEALGVDRSGQLRKIRRSPWASGKWGVKSLLAPDGRRRQLACIDLERLPMWLANIEANRVSPAVRDRLALYQNEAADVLAAHFLHGGRREAHTLEAAPELARLADRLGECVVLLTEGQREVRGEIRELRETVSDVRGEVTDLRTIVERRRTRISEETKARLKEFTFHVYRGVCPCCDAVQVVDSPTRCTKFGQFDHYDSTGYAHIDGVWIVCRKCNVALCQPKEKRKVHSAFVEYHRKRERWSGPLFKSG